LSTTPSSTDIAWKLEYTPTSFRQTTARLCLLERLYAKVPPKQRAAISDKLALKIPNLYRMFLTNMLNAGWDQVKDNKRFQYVRNCPPVGVRTQTTKAKTCNLGHICPFCWVRNNTVQTFERFERAFFAPKGLREDLPFKVKLISTLSCGTSQKLPEHSTMELAPLFRARLKRVASNVESSRKDEVDSIPKSQFLGGVVIQSIDYSREQPVRYRGGLFVVAQKATLPFEAIETPHYQSRTTELSRANLKHAMVRVAPYPGGWIRRASPEQTMAYLDAIHGLRMLSTYGALRESHSAFRV